MRAVAASGVKIVMATHDLGQARRLAGESCSWRAGGSSSAPRPRRFSTHPRRREAAAFLRGDLVI